MHDASLSQFIGAAALAIITANAGDARADVTTCASLEENFFGTVECRDPNTGVVVGAGAGVVLEGTDRFMSVQIGRAGGKFPFKILRGEVVVKDDEGQFLEDCNPLTENPAGAFIFGFGIQSPACDAGATIQMVIVYDDDVRV